jgi:hypothetical protein
MDILRCPRCGWEFSPGLGYYENELIDNSREPVAVALEWERERPTPREIRLARQLIPGWADRPLAPLVRELKKARRYEVGVFRSSEAAELRQRAKEIGVDPKRRWDEKGRESLILTFASVASDPP